ncbi:hypothetical protein KC333_g9187 [Hortaea werneckii]|nr:hypothetical protein KC333_g9187 [Hortaea werneckii]KAI7301411.1 hypothetical protein KC326_g9164 [Hortaea werneckii]
MPRRERSPPPPVPPIPAPFRHAYAGIGTSNNPVPSTPSNRSPNDHANSLRKAKSAVEMSSAYERKRRTALPPSKLRESVSANEVPSAAESFGHSSRIQAAPAPVDEVNRSRLTTKKSLPSFSLKKPTSARSLDINASANTREDHASDVPGNARRVFMDQRNEQQGDQSRLRDTDAISPSQRSELNYEHALEKLGWLDRLKRKAMSAGKDASGPDKRRDAPVNTSTHTALHTLPAAETNDSTRLDHQSSTPDVNANKSGKSPRWTEPVKHVTGVGSLIKPKSPSVESARTFLSKPSPLTSSSSDSLSTSTSKMEARKEPSPLERMQKARMQTATSTRPSHLRDAMGVHAASSERDDPFLDASSTKSSTKSSTAPPADANVLPWNYQKADGSFSAALLGAGGSSNELKYANAAAFKGDSQPSPETPYTPTRSGNQALRAAKSESSIKSTFSLGVINPPSSKKSLEYSIENPDHMPHTHFYKAIQTPSPQPPRARSPAEDPEWPRMVAKARRDIEIHDQKIAQAKEEARIRALEQEEADERKARNEMEERLIERSSEFGMVPLKDFMEMTDDELSFYSKTLTAELVSIKERTDAEDAAAQSGIRNLFKKGGPSKAQAEVEERRLEKVLFLRDQGRKLEKAQKESLRRFSEASRAMGNKQTGETSRQKNVETPLSSSTSKAETTTPPMAGPAPEPKDVHQQKAAKASPSFIPVAKAGQATALSTPPKYTHSRTSDKSTSFTPDTIKEERGKTLRALRGPSPPSIVHNLPSDNKPIGLGIAHVYGGQVGHADDAAAGPSVNKGKGRAREPTPDSTPQVPRAQGGLGKGIESDRFHSTSPVSSIHSDEARELETTVARDTNRENRVSLLSPLDQAPIKVAYRPVIEEGQGEGSPATTTFKVDRNESFKAMIAAEAAKRARMLNAPGAPIHPAFRQGEGDTGVQNVPSTERLPSREGCGPLPMPAHPAFRTTGAGPGNPVAPATAPVESITWFSEPIRTVSQDEENESEESYGGMNINFDAEIKEIEEWTTPSSQRTNVNSPPTQPLPPSNLDGSDALRAEMDLAPLRLHNAASGQPKHPHHEFAFDTEKLMCYMKHNNLPNETAATNTAADAAGEGPSGDPKAVSTKPPTTPKLLSVHGLGSRNVSRCSHCASFCCTYAENLYASRFSTRKPDVQHIQQQALAAVNRLSAEHPNGVETFDVFLTCAECSKVICPQCVVVCEEVFCREMLCEEHAVEGRCEYHGRG